VELGGERVPLDALPNGYFGGHVSGITPGDAYWFVLDGERRRSDPASRDQPEGVHGPSAVVDLRFPFAADDFAPPPPAHWIIYELHVGAFTRDGTFAAAIDRLDRLVELGVSAVELMPVAQFPGARNWGYDGVCPFAVHADYGGAAGLAAFVDACHARGLAVILDVVYNHLGPEGNHLGDFAPYFTDRYRTPWGPAVNFDGPDSDEVRRYFIENAAMWLEDFHIDGLRLDAVHAILDASPRPFLLELAERVDAMPRPRVLIAESDANDPRLVRPRSLHGLGMDAVWADDFHHAVHVLLTGERDGYYRDYLDRELLPEALTHGFAYRGRWSEHRRRRHGAPCDDISPSAFVICVQNHDQVGNRVDGSRLSSLTTLAGERLAAGLLLVAPEIPLLFMGQEYGETRPFAYFTSHGDPELVEAVRRGRKQEFAAFDWQREPPDPQALQTFLDSKLEPERAKSSPHREIAELYRTLIALRREYARHIVGVRPRCELVDGEQVLVMHLGPAGDLVLLASLEPNARTTDLPLPAGSWRVLIDAEDPRFGGDGAVLDEAPQPGATVALPGFWFALLRRAG
jgi:maltooligosyltrehalose trehalohydrolase